MSDVLDRIKALIARTASSSEEEARTSAVIACRMIREHEILLVDPKGSDNDAIHADSLGDSLEDIAKNVWDFLERRESRRRPHGAAQAQARAYRQRYEDPAPRSVYPFDPFTAPFSTVQAYVKQRSIDVHDNRDGTYSATSGFRSIRGTWPEVVRFMFTIIEQRSSRSPR